MSLAPGARGRAQTQATDGLYYVCLVRARALGVPWYGWCAQGGGFAFDAGCALGRRLPPPAAAHDGDEGSEEEDADMMEEVDDEFDFE